jgi:acyl-CoA synthetase (AMP-forming)/AMP-acid ligase II
MRTGDLGRWDEKGRLHLTGRLKDVIITGGMNVAPVEIEAVACSHPDVMSAAVVGIPDVRWGETPVVVAVTRNGSAMAAAELLAFCRGELASFKRPTGAAVVDDLPLTGIGKLAKNELRESILRGELRLVRSV